VLGKCRGSIPGLRLRFRAASSMMP